MCECRVGRESVCWMDHVVVGGVGCKRVVVEGEAVGRGTGREGRVLGQKGECRSERRRKVWMKVRGGLEDRPPSQAKFRLWTLGMGCL